jgi:replication factor C subunit 3/5
MFLVDKYTPKDIEDVLFHEDIYNLLKNMAKDKSIPHIIFHGVLGSGKKTMINIFLKMLYNKDVYDVYDTTYKVTGSSNKTTIETLKRSDYHIVIKPKSTNYDRYLLRDVVKEYAKRVELGGSDSDKTFRVVRMDNLDKFTYYAQTSLRRTIENYSSNCRFIMWCDSLSKVIQPLQSRCICIRLPTLSNVEMLQYIYSILALERKYLPMDKVSDIIDMSNGYTKGALWNLDKVIRGISPKTDYDKVIKKLSKIIISRDIENIYNIRDDLYKLYITMIPYDKMIEDLLTHIVASPKIRQDVLVRIMVKLAELEHNLVRCRRGMIHFDCVIATTMNILRKNP